MIANDSVVEIGENGLLQFGNDSRFNGGLRLSCQEAITFGNSVLASWDVSVFDTDFHRMKDCSTYEKLKTCSKKIEIGDGCWLGFGSTIMKGAVLGKQCVLGAKSIITKDYSDCSYTILAGNPAKPVKKGFYLDVYDS